MWYLLRDTVSLKTSLTGKIKFLEIKAQRLKDFLTAMKAQAESKCKSWSAPYTSPQCPMEFLSLQLLWHLLRGGWEADGLIPTTKLWIKQLSFRSLPEIAEGLSHAALFKQSLVQKWACDLVNYFCRWQWFLTSVCPPFKDSFKQQCGERQTRTLGDSCTQKRALAIATIFISH